MAVADAWVARRLWQPLRDTIRLWAERHGLDLRAAVVYGSASAAPERAPDVDVMVFVGYDRGLAKSPGRLRNLRLELKAEWDAWAEERGLPALDPLIVVGYRPLYMPSAVRLGRWSVTVENAGLVELSFPGMHLIVDSAKEYPLGEHYLVENPRLALELLACGERIRRLAQREG